MLTPHAREVYAEQPVFDTEELPPHVVFTPYLRALAKEIVGDETNALLKARKIYDFITTQAVYRFMPPYLTVPNIPEYFLSGLRGDCGVQAITFVTLCRLCGVPAQWQSGLYTKPEQRGSSRLGAVLCRAVRLAVCGLLVRRLSLSRGRSGSLEFLFRQS